MDLIIAIDLGTSSLKFTAYDPAQGEIQSSSSFHPADQPAPDRREQSAELLLQRVQESLDKMFAALPPEPVRIALSFSGAMHSLLAVDKNRRVLMPAILWSDQRATAIAARLRASAEGQEIYRRTGVPIHAMSPLVKIIWMREEEPEIFSRAACWMGLKEYVWSGLFPEKRWVMDHAMASATGLMNLRDLTWDPLALSVAGIDASKLPELVPVHYRGQARQSGQAEYIGLIGASDGALANLGVGAMTVGELALSLGTSGAVRQVLTEPYIDPAMRSFCYRLDEQYFIAGGATNNGFNVLYWIWCQILGKEWDESAIFESLGKAPVGAGGLSFLPYLLGERAPWWDNKAKGAFFGLTDQHSPGHLLRAGIEGVLFHLHNLAGILAEQNPFQRVVLAAGGEIQMNLADMIAPIFGKPTEVRSLEDAASMGAIRLACKALNLPEPEHGKGGYEVFPDAEEADRYAAAAERFQRLLDTLQPIF